MKCPRTGSELKVIKVAGVELDFSTQCGGVWFDQAELARFDESHEEAGEALADLMRESKSLNLDLNARLHCPKCKDVVLMRRYYSPKKSIAIDECPSCSGIWLDAGELKAIRDTFPHQDDLKAEKAAFKQEIQSSDMVQNHLASIERVNKVADFMSILSTRIWRL